MQAVVAPLRTANVTSSDRPGWRVSVLSATSSSVVAAGQSQKATWPAWASLEGDPCAPPSAPAAGTAESGPAADAVTVAAATVTAAAAATTQHRPRTLPTPQACPTASCPAGAGVRT